MLYRLRQLPTSSRVLLVVLVVLGVLAQPVLVAACEIHEAQHQVATGHAHDGPEHSDGADSAHPSPDERGGLAELVHLGHCCAHATVLAMAVEPPSAHGVDVAPAGLLWNGPLTRRPARLLRPPIG